MLSISWLFRSLGGNFLLFMAAGAFLPLLVLGTAAYFISIDAIKKQSSTLTTTIVQEKAANITNLMDEAQSLAQSILSNQRFTSVIASGAADENFDRLSTQSTIGELLGGYLHMNGLVGIDVNMLDERHYHVGEMLESTEFDATQRDALLNQCQESSYGLCWPGITPNMLLRSRYGLTIPAIKVLKNLDQNSMQESPTGILYLAFSMDSFYERIHSGDTQGVTYIVVDKHWRLIYHPDKSRVNTQLESTIRSQIKGDHGRFTSVFEGRESELIYQQLKGADWRLIGVIPTESLKEMIYEIQLVTIGFVLFSILLLTLGMLYANTQIIKPIEKITKEFDTIKNQDTALSLLEKSRVSEIEALMHGLEEYFETIQKERQKSNELNDAYHKLRETQKQLVESEKMASLGALVAGIAHEINTPLGISVTAVSIISEKVNEVFEKIQNNTLKKTEMLDAINRLKDSSTVALSNLDRASVLVQSFKQTAVDQSIEDMRKIDLKRYLQELIFSLQPQYKNKNIHISVICNEDFEIESYPGAIAQIFTNLIMNALIHAFEADRSGNIKIELTKESGMVRIDFSDDGKGIPQENLSKIFEPFFTTKRNKGGTGLGLHIIYNLITQKLKGKISCTSKLGAGTNFRILIPTEPTPSV